jgi:hypothetical protein
MIERPRIIDVVKMLKDIRRRPAEVIKFVKGEE